MSIILLASSRASGKWRQAVKDIFISVNLADVVNRGFTRIVQQYADQFHQVSLWLLFRLWMRGLF